MGRALIATTAGLLLGALAVAGVGLSGCASSGGPPDPPVSSGPPGTDPDPNATPYPDPDPQPGGISATQRAQSAVEGLVMGAVIGSQAGPIGAAVLGGTFAIYSAVTGSVPFQGGVRGGGAPGGGGMPRSEREREDALEDEIEAEMARGEHLEGEIEAELNRQEELLKEIEAQEVLARADEPAVDAVEPQSAPELDVAELSRRADPRIAPEAPRDRELPLSLFDESQATIARGEWGDNKKLKVVVRSLDADRDGRPEQVRYFDQTSGKLIRKEQDRDYDGTFDAWTSYEQGAVVARVLDTNNDGESDVWERYAGGLMTSREIDRDNDGVRDAFYRYEGDSLARESHDANNDGELDAVVTYENRQRVRSEEDGDRDGRMDTWTTYRVENGEEIVARVERDTKGKGEPTLFETFGSQDGRPVLAKREEDVDGDGTIDVTSTYQDGRLVSREISDPSLMPL